MGQISKKTIYPVDEDITMLFQLFPTQVLPQYTFLRQSLEILHGISRLAIQQKVLRKEHN